MANPLPLASCFQSKGGNKYVCSPLGGNKGIREVQTTRYRNRELEMNSFFAFFGE